MKRHSAWVLAMSMTTLLGCGGDDSGGAEEVDQLDEDAHVELCEEFVAGVCAHDGFEDWCAECATADLCAQDDLVATMDQECDGITVGQVHDCAESGDVATCLEGGGCVFDVGDLLCER